MWLLCNQANLMLPFMIQYHVVECIKFSKNNNRLIIIAGTFVYSINLKSQEVIRFELAGLKKIELNQKTISRCIN